MPYTFTITIELEQKDVLDRVQLEVCRRVLELCGGNITLAARMLGMHRQSLQRKAKRLAP